VLRADRELLLAGESLARGGCQVTCSFSGSGCDPKAWPSGLILNYRNCLYSCNRFPVKTHIRAGTASLQRNTVCPRVSVTACRESAVTGKLAAVPKKELAVGSS